MSDDGNAGVTVDVYAVGIVRDWRHARRTGEYPSRFRWFLRSWRRRSYWNGYLAEPTPWPDGIGLTHCGSGWTRRAAERDLARRWSKAARAAGGTG